MAYPDGVYLLVRNEYSLTTRVTTPNKYICYVHNGYRSTGVGLDTPISEISPEWRPYASTTNPAKTPQLIFIGSWDLIRGMSVIAPDMTSGELLQALNINHES